MYKVFFLLLVLTAPVYAQDFNLDDYLPINVPEQVETDTVLEPEIAPEIENLPPFANNTSDEDRLAEMNRILEEMKALSGEIKVIVEEQKESLQTTKMSFNDAQVLDLEERVSTLENKNFVTREEVKTIVEEEVKKYVELTFKSGDKVTKQKVAMSETSSAAIYNKVAVPGYAGTFDVPEGAVITHVDGIPVNQYTTNLNKPVAYSGRYIMQANLNNRRWGVRITQPVLGPNCVVENGIVKCR